MNNLKNLTQREIDSVSGGGKVAHLFTLAGTTVGALTGLSMCSDPVIATIVLAITGRKIGRLAGNCVENMVTT